MLDNLPLVLTVHGWTLSSPFADEWRCRLIALPDVVPPCACDLTGDGPLHLFTDGSCFGLQSQHIVLLRGASVSLLLALVLMLSQVMWLAGAASQA